MRTTRSMTMITAALAFVACDDGTGPRFDDATTATLSFAVTRPVSSLTTWLGMAPAVVVTDAQGRTLDVTQIQVVMEEVELKRAFHDDCVGEDDDACEAFEIGPVLIDLPVSGGVISPFSVAIPADTYDELELEIDDAEDDSTSIAFFAQHPSWPEFASIRVAGTFDANDGAGPQAFDIYMEVSVEIERDLVPPLVVSDSTQSVNVTVAVDVASWFADETGGLIDPRSLSASGSLIDVVEDNIEDSFEAFEDDDHDGDDDSDDDDSDVDSDDDDSDDD